MNAKGGSRGPAVLVAALALLVIAIVILLLLRAADEAGPQPPADPLAALLKLRRQLEWPGLEVAPAAKALGTKEQAFDFVKNGILYVQYRGMWGGAAGTLRSRIGNSTDKAALLAALLKELGYETQMVRADYPAKAEPYVGKGMRRAFPAVAEVRAALALPPVSPGPGSPGPDPLRKELLGDMRKEVDASIRALKALVEKDRIPIALEQSATPQERADVVPVRARHWVWVRARRGPDQEWSDLDPVFPHLSRPAFASTFDPSGCILHVDLSVVHPDGGTESVVGWSGPAARVLGHDISLTFLPAKGTLKLLETVAEPARVPLWTAVLQLGPICRRGGAFTPDGLVLRMHDGQVRAGPGTAATRDADGRVRIQAVPVKALSVKAVDTREYPRVKVHLAVEAQAKPYWHHRHFSITSADAPSQSFPARIESASMARRPVVLVVDTSLSMFKKEDGGPPPRIELARAALRKLLDELPADLPVSLASFAADVVTHVKPAPLRQNRARLLEAVAKLSERWHTYIPEAVSGALRQSQAPAYVVFLTDGQDNRKNDWEAAKTYRRPLAKAVEALRRSPHRLIPVGIGEADHDLLGKLARASGTRYHRVTDPQNLADVYASIGAELAGRATVSFVDRPRPRDEAGKVRKVRIQLAGFPRSLEAAYKIPAPAAAAGRYLRLTIRVSGGGCPSREFARAVQDLSKDADPWGRIASYRIGFALAAVPSRLALARFVDEMIDLCRLRRMGAGGPRPTEFSSRRGLCRQSVAIINGALGSLSELAGEEAKPGWRGPTLFIRSARMAGRPEGPALRRELDFLHHSYGPRWDAPRRMRMRWGLALAAVEGRLLRTDSVNRRLLARADSLAVVRRGQDLPAATGRGAGLLHSALAEGGFVVHTPEAPGCAWAVHPSGRLQAVLTGPPQAKGASVEETAAGYKRIRTVLQILGALASGVLAAGESPNGALFTALCNFYDEEMKLWCFSSVMLGLVAEGIEEGQFDPEKAKARAQKLCELEGKVEDFWMNLGAAFAAGWAGGKAEDWACNLLGRAGPTGRFFAAAAAGYFDPIPGAGVGFMGNVRTALSGGN